MSEFSESIPCRVIRECRLVSERDDEHSFADITVYGRFAELVTCRNVFVAAWEKL